MARQPILDSNDQTAGYEFLYRAAAGPEAEVFDVDAASRDMLERILLLGCREISGGNRLFIHCSGEVLAREYISVFPPQAIVVEIMETVEPTAAVLATCEQLKCSGFMIALDGFVPGPNTLPLVPFADIIKVDFRATDARVRAQIVERYCRQALPLAEKVETHAEYKSALDGGFKLFQGYYFCEPVLLANRELGPSQINYLRLMEQTSRAEIDVRQMEEAITSDPALYGHLVRFLNSYAFCLRSTITSIRHAATLLGEHPVRRWIAVACACVAGKNSAPCLLASALMRSRFGEALAPQIGFRPYDLFLLGLFSVMDAILGIPLKQLLAEIKVPPDIEAALLGKPNRLRDILDLIIAYDRANWDKTKDLCAKLHLNQSDLADDYIRALLWVDQILGMTMEQPPPIQEASQPESQAALGNGLRTA